MTALRSLLFNIVFYLNLILFLVVGLPLFLGPRRWAIAALKLWATTSVWLLKVICGTAMEVRGRHHMPKGPLLVAGKHQSFWETFAILPLLDDPCMVLKRELTFIPVFGWFALKFRMIAVERDAGPQHFTGRFALGNGRLALPSVTFDVPGALVEMSGQYGMKQEDIAFDGNLYMDAKISQTVTGFKSLLLKVVDPLFRRDGRTVVPLKISGTRNDPKFGVNMGRVFRRGDVKAPATKH